MILSLLVRYCHSLTYTTTTTYLSYHFTTICYVCTIYPVFGPGQSDQRTTSYPAPSLLLFPIKSIRPVEKVLYKLFFDAPVAFSAAAAAAAAMMGQPPVIHAAPAMPAMPAMQPGMQFGMIPPQPNPHAAAAMAAMFGQPVAHPAMAMPAGPFGMFGAIPRFR